MTAARAYSLTGRGMASDTAAYMGDTPMAARRALDDCLDIYRNEDGLMRDKAIGAIADGRPAFWTMSNYHNALSYDLPLALNAGVDIDRALDNAFRSRPYHSIHELDRLIPLNMAAARALGHAYSRHGSWRDDEELLMRSKRDMRLSCAFGR